MNILVFVSQCLCSQAMNTLKIRKFYLLVRKMIFKGVVEPSITLQSGE